MRKLFVILMMLVCHFSMAQTRLDYFITEATNCRLQNQWSQAEALYRHCIEIDPLCAEALFQMGTINIYLRRDSIGLDYIQKAVDLDTCNTYYLESLASLLIRRGCEEQALPLLERISSLETKRSDVLLHLANLYTKFERLQDAIDVYNRLETLEGKMLRLTESKFLLYMQLGDSVSAFAEMQALCDEYPAEMSYKVEMGYYYQQLGDFDRAMDIYTQVRQIDSTNIPLQMAMLDYYLMQGNDSLHAVTRDSILYAPTTSTDKRVVLLQQMIQRMPNDSLHIAQVNERFERVLQLDSTNVEMLIMYASYLNYCSMPMEQIRDVMVKILYVMPDNSMAMEWLLQYYSDKSDYASLEEICRKGMNYRPQDLMYAYFLGVILYQQNKPQEALDALDKGLRLRSSEVNRKFLSDVFTLRGDIYYDINKSEEAFHEYDSALVYNKDNILCLNNYAYFLSLRNEQMDRAEEMSYRTIKAAPRNKTYIDTYAWILFMQGKYVEAQIYMEDVVPRDSTEDFLLNDEYTTSAILEHAADIAWMNGEQDRAVYLWTLAIKRGDDDITPILIKKAKKKKYYKTKH